MTASSTEVTHYISATSHLETAAIVIAFGLAVATYFRRRELPSALFATGFGLLLLRYVCSYLLVLNPAFLLTNVPWFGGILPMLGAAAYSILAFGVFLVGGDEGGDRDAATRPNPSNG